MEITLEKIIEIVTREVIKELVKKGITINTSALGEGEPEVVKRSDEIDMSEFKTPILTENNLGYLDKNICEVIVPEKTIITPGARRIIKQRSLTVIYKS